MRICLRRLWGSGFLGFSLITIGCATCNRVDQFSLFAHAGREYSQAMAVLCEQVAQVAIDADSYLLLHDRDLFEPRERQDIYQERTAALQELLTAMQQLRRHAMLLERYFEVLARMADREGMFTAYDESARLAAALEELSPRLSRTLIGSNKVADFMPPARPLLVAGVQRHLLARELERNAVLIERELRLQQAALTALAGGLKADLAVIARARSYNEVALPYITPGRLPANWLQRRREILAVFVDLGTVDNAADAARELQRMFGNLVENRIGPGDWSKLFQNIDAIVELLEVSAVGG